jgi:HEAT repeat protein
MPENPNLQPSQQASEQQPSEQNEGNAPVNVTATTEQASTSVNADLNHISGGANVAIAGQNVINIRVDTLAQAREIFKVIKEEEVARQRPAPPPADATVQEKVNHWFKNDLKNDRQRFFVITLGIFNGLKYADFKDIYEIVLEVMKIKSDSEKKKNSSYFDNSDIELTNKARAEIVREQGGLEEILKFSEPEYESAVIQLLRDNYRNVLLDLLPALKRIGEYSYWEIRSRAAEAVAEIGKMGFFRVRSQVLEPWSRDQRPYVRAAVGYALSRLYDDQNMRTAVNDLLSNWSDLEQPWSDADWAWRVRWTAASVYKQIGLKDPETAFVGLKRIARHDNIRVADAVIHTLVVLSLQGHLESVICTLGDWVAEGTGGRDHDKEREIVCIVAILAFVVLSGIHVEVSKEEDTLDAQSDQFKAKAGNFFELVRKSAAERGKVWQAVVGLGVRALEYKLVDPFFDMIELWAKPAFKDNRLRDTLCDLLAEVFQSTRPANRERILNQLNKWERKTKDEALSSVAHSVKSEIKRRVLG